MDLRSTCINETALHAAAASCDAELLDAVLAALPDQEDRIRVLQRFCICGNGSKSTRRTPLHIACSALKSAPSADAGPLAGTDPQAVLSKLLRVHEECGITVNLSEPPDNVEPFLLAASSGSVAGLQALCKHGANVNAADQQNNTPLMAAVRSGSLEAVKYLAEDCGADTHAAMTWTAETALHIAVTEEPRHAQQILRVLLAAGAPVHARDTDHKTATHCAAEFGRGLLVRPA